MYAEAGFRATVMGTNHQEELLHAGDFIAVDVRDLSHDNDPTPTLISPLVPQKTLSRKGTQRDRGERPPPPPLPPASSAAEEDDMKATIATTFSTATGGCDKTHLLVHVAGEQGLPALPPVPSPAAAAAAGERWRRVGNRRSRWLSLTPSRVMIFFSALSSMGTLLLLYFALSTGSMEDGVTNTR